MSKNGLRRCIVFVSAGIVLAVLAIVLLTVIIPKVKKNNEHKTAAQRMNDGNIVDAYESGYNDSNEIASGLFKQFQLLKMKKTDVGDSIFFGTYEQDNDQDNGKEEIEWIVLAKEDNKLLVVSKYALDSLPYNNVEEEVTWKTCTLREWLNEEFYYSAFNPTEQAMIQSATVPADKSPEYDTPPGKDTTDKVFLLSIAEANKYFSSNDARMCQATAYCVAQGAYQDDNGYCWWWLRSPGRNSKCATPVFIDGSIYSFSNRAHLSRGAVRPAMWIDLEA